MIHSFSFSEIGQKERQEDCIFPSQDNTTEENHIFLLCDGLGGHADGHIASNCVANTIGNYMTEQEVADANTTCGQFNEALSLAYTNLSEQNTEEQERPMGTTIALLAQCTDGILTAHIGDSRVYQLRRGETPIRFCTRDHSYVNELYAAGKITLEEAQTHPQRGAVTRAIIANDSTKAQATFNLIKDIQPDDVFMLCSDGIIEQVNENEIAEILLKEAPLEERTEQLRQLCEERNTSDNFSCIILQIDENLVATVAEPQNEPAENAEAALAAKIEPTETPNKKKKSKRRLWIILILLLLAVAAATYFFITSYDANTAPPQKETPAKQTTTASAPKATADTTAVDSTTVDSLSANADKTTPKSGRRKAARSFNNDYYDNYDSDIVETEPTAPAEETVAPAPVVEEPAPASPSDTKAQKPQRKPRQQENRNKSTDDDDWY